MAFFLVDLEFREKARNLLTTREVYFCILFAVFAMVNWSSIISVASGLLGGGGGDAAADALHSASDPSSAQAVGDGFNGFGGEDDPDTICNHHNHRTGCFNT